MLKQLYEVIVFFYSLKLNIFKGYFTFLFLKNSPITEGLTVMLSRKGSSWWPSG